MVKKIKIKINAIGEIYAELLEKKNPKTVDAIWNKLPFNNEVNKWGDEIYFSIPVILNEENAQANVGVGDLGYWPPGHAFCIFFGPTPISQRGEIKPANPVNVFGKIIGDSSVFKNVKSQENIRIEKA